MKNYLKYFACLSLFFCNAYAIPCPVINDSTERHVETIDVYLDCDDCDMTFIKTKIPYVNYVRDPQTAQVLIKIIHQNTGSGGRKYTLNFLGREEFEDISHELEYTSLQIDSRDDDRRGITHTIAMGLMPYLSRTPLAPLFKIKFDEDKEVLFEQDDPWDSWIFHINLSGNYEAEETQNELSLTGEIRANHTTENLKVRSRVKYDYEREKIQDDGESVKSILRELETDISVVKSINKHWSYGVSSGINSTTFRNIDFSVSLAPAIEYNFFPWSRSYERIVALSYNIGSKKLDYLERTIFGKTSELIFYQSAGLQVEIIEPWWEVFAYIQASHLFDDFQKNKLEFNSNISLKVIQGFSLAMYIDVERPHDQIYLPQEGATRDEILLKRKKLATDYELTFSFGIQYSFGSIYNNIVNRRL